MPRSATGQQTAQAPLVRNTARHGGANHPAGQFHRRNRAIQTMRKQQLLKQYMRAARPHSLPEATTQLERKGDNTGDQASRSPITPQLCHDTGLMAAGEEYEIVRTRVHTMHSADHVCTKKFYVGFCAPRCTAMDFKKKKKPRSAHPTRPKFFGVLDTFSLRPRAQASTSTSPPPTNPTLDDFSPMNTPRDALHVVPA